ncbi:hypothetical protein Rsub_07449 [Raphidocelis subcapitata]|uniref:GB1/RHD3-type G domain-containing protein n=1 Tax=Raphidocelis subcapitata TaxID=307507 RepID=A0A2V0P511_9CHLO|nr:hypothetical protein Rsub_07449 [Raphidocelis subcapitata]|eukprot:GBF94948.1 hypothetical protein Rsub_07449 [Raphidocelis subcapitata]
MEGEAIELVRFDAGRFELGARALDVLRATQGPLAVVAVCGRARQGKSFILNQLLSVTGGFRIGSTHRPCTKGLWMWSAPQACVDADGRPFHLVLLDSEGIDACDQTAQYSTQIFSLAVLLSSLFVYNQMGGIDEAALDRLSLVVEITKHIRVRAAADERGGSPGGAASPPPPPLLAGGMGGAGAAAAAGWPGTMDADAAAELRRFTPSFLWLLRDFYLRLEDENGRQARARRAAGLLAGLSRRRGVVSAREYLESALTPAPGPGAAAAAKNAVRASIKSLFPDRDCAMLVRPMHEERALVCLDSTPAEQLRPEFREGLILRKARPKRLGSHTITGPLLAALAEAYVGAINAGAVPTIATAWQGVAERECRRAAEAAEAAYAAQFQEGVDPEEECLDKEHARALGAARAAFAAVAVGERAVRRAHETRCLEACAARFAQLRACRLAEASAAVSDLLLAGAGALSEAAAAAAASAAARGEDAVAGPGPGSAAAAMERELCRFLDGYAASARGPAKWPRLLAFLKTALPPLLRASEAAGEARGRGPLEAAERRAAEAGARADGLAARLAAAEAEAADAARRASERAAELADARVAAEQGAARASLLEAELSEARLIAERRLLGAQQESEARARAEAERRASEAAAFEARIGEERRRREAVEAEASELRARADALGGMLAAAQDEAGGYLDSFGDAKREQARLQLALEEAAAELTSIRLSRAAVVRERDEALSEAASLRAAVDAMDCELEARLREAEREVGRSGGGGGGGGGSGGGAAAAAADAAAAAAAAAAAHDKARLLQPATGEPDDDVAPDQLRQAAARFGCGGFGGGACGPGGAGDGEPSSWGGVRLGSSGGGGGGLGDGPFGPLAGMPPAVLERLLSGGEDAPDP